MKRIIYSLLLFGFLPFSVSAQLVPGFKIGGNYSSYQCTYHEAQMAVEYDFMAGLQTGFTLDYFLTDRLSMRGELLFSQTGARTQKNYGDLSVKNLQVNYLNLPLLFKVKSIKNLFFTGGGVGGFRISKDILDFTGFNRLDFALAGGVGYDFNRNCGFEFRYNHGVMAVGSTPILYNEKTVGSFATHSRCFQLAVEYRLATKRF